MRASIRRIERLLAEPADPRLATCESGLSTRNRRLIDAERRLRTLTSRRPDDAALQLLAARTASALGHWDDAIPRWTRVLRTSPAHRTDALHHLAIAYRSVGSYQRAHRVLAQLRGSDLPREALRAEQRSLAELEDHTAAYAVSNRALASRPSPSGGAPSSSQLLDVAADLRGDTAEVARCVRTVHDDVVLGHRPRAGEADDHPPSVPVVFLSGFGWSGTGALFDHYRQSATAVTPFGAGEIGAFERVWGAKRALRSLRKRPEQRERALIDFIFQAVFGIAGPKEAGPKPVWDRSLLAALSTAGAPLDEVADACIELFHGARRASGVEAQEAAFRRFFDRVFAHLVPVGRVALTSNCITAVNIDLLRCVGGSTGAVVMRDPRDMWVAQVLEYPGRDGLSVDSFISKFRSRRERHREALRRWGPADRVAEVQFEEFVRSRAEREALGARLGLEPVGTPSRDAYRPEASLPNIGIHRTYRRRDELRRIEEAFPDLLVHARERSYRSVGHLVRRRG